MSSLSCKREVDALALAAVAERGVVNVDACHEISRLAESGQKKKP